MPLIAIPNVSEGADAEVIARLAEAAASNRARILDVHSDEAHGRTVLTLTGTQDELIRGIVELALVAIRAIDLRSHGGAHPRLGALDVCPFVPHGESTMEQAIHTARRAAPLLSDAARIPVYLYGRAALRNETRDLPALRSGGLEELSRRALTGLPPDHGGPEISPSAGVVCVGARNVLIAFNIWLRCAPDVARAIAGSVRTSKPGSTVIRALGLDVGDGWAQISMNLIEPDERSIDSAFVAVKHAAVKWSVEPVRTEIVGLVPERYLPNPDAEAARLLDPPGRSLESALRERKQ